MPRGPWIQTFSGRKFHPLDVQPEDIHLDDVAHSLSHICRFNGHCRDFYSVAQHSVLVAELCEREWPGAALWGLLHDASEAYIGDVTRPVKGLLADFRAIEDTIAAAVVARFRVPCPAEVQAAVHLADERLLATEARDLMAAPPTEWGLRAAPLDFRIVPWSPVEARGAFAAAFERLSASAPTSSSAF